MPRAPQLTPEQARDAIVLIKAELKRKEDLAENRVKATEKFRSFVEQAWPTVEPARKFVHSWHVDAIADHLAAVADGHIRNLAISVPPGHAKSIIVSVMWPAWMWVRDPKWRTICCSYAGELAVRDSVRCRALIESQWYKELFEPAWKMASDQNVKAYFENTEKGSRFSTSVGSKGTGFRSDNLVADDALNAKDQFSDAALEECAFWWDNVMSSRLNDMATGTKVIIAQRLSERDLIGHVLERGGYDYLMLPTEFDPGRRCRTSIGFVDPRQKEGELLFPRMFPEFVVAQAKRDLSSDGFSAQHQQSPVPVGGGMLKKHWWKYWQPKGANLRPVPVKMPSGEIEMRPAVTLPDKFDQVIQSWDMAFKATATSDFVVGQVHAASGTDRFILDQVRDRMDLPDTLLACRRLSAKWPNAHVKLVEDKANGPAVVQMLRKEIQGFIEVTPEGGKISRAAAAAAGVESGNWYLPHPLMADWVDGFLAETSTFPAGANDDSVDSWSQGARRLMGVALRQVNRGPIMIRAGGGGGDRSWMS